jgi:hypothetical protein
MQGDDYAFALGKLHGNLRAIETVARQFLAGAETPDPDRLQAGDALPASAWTDDRDLRALLDAYNALAPAELRVDADLVVSIRDVLGRSRACGPAQTFPLRFLQFGAPSADGRVIVKHAQVLDQGWLVYQIHATFLVFGRIEAACERSRH